MQLTRSRTVEHTSASTFPSTPFRTGYSFSDGQNPSSRRSRTRALRVAASWYWTVAGSQEGQSASGDRSEHWDGGLSPPGWEHEFEERNGIAQLALEWAQRAVATPDDQDDAFHEQGHDGEAKDPVSASGQRTRPEVPEADKVDYGDQLVGNTEGLGGPIKETPLLMTPRSQCSQLERFWSTSRRSRAPNVAFTATQLPDARPLRAT